jgi:hypothetical protein
MKWLALDYCVEYMKHAESKDLTMIYEFGTFNCDSLVYLEKHAKQKDVKYKKIIGFDSFKGFPDFKNEYAVDPNTYTAWESMDFSCIKHDSEIETKLTQLKRKFIDEPILVPGFYEDSLKDSIVQDYNLEPALFLHIDCDLYTSTYTVLDFMYRNNLIRSGTIIKYDEWGPLFKPGEPFGEERAHLEMIEKYGGEFETLQSIGDKIIFRRL